MTKLVIIDGHAILHRAYHALPPLTSKVGQINAVYGFTSMLLKIIADLEPSYLAVCLDRKEETFRKKMFKDYQAQRPETDRELISQVEKTKMVIEAFGVPIFSKAGYEADDVIGTLSQKAEKEAGIDKIIIVTGDRDILQLVGGKVLVYLLVRGISEAKLFDRESTKEKMGIYPEQIVDYKALVGDPSDNYPGVSGIGPKTAEKLLLKYKTKEAIYRHLNEVDEKTRKVLENGKKGADISYKLAKIDTKVPIKVDFKAMSRWSVYNQKVEEVFTELGFKSLKERVKKISTKRISQDQGSLF